MVPGSRPIDTPLRAGKDADRGATSRWAASQGGTSFIANWEKSEVEDYSPALKQGRKPQELLPLYSDLLERVAQLDAGGPTRTPSPGC